jgi:uncharacterized membrane protein YqjE
MKTAPPGPTGFVATLRTLGDHLLAGAQERLELFSLELQEEKFRLVRAFVWICAALFTGMLALTFASLALVYCFWDSARLAVLGGLAMFYAAALGAIILGYRCCAARQPVPFAATRQEIAEDRACITTGN